MASQSTTLIIGAGIFGTSTAYHLAQNPSLYSSLTIVDPSPFPQPPASHPTNHALGASADINKIVRADYSSPFYVSLGYEAIDAWSTWPILKPFYHRTGWVMVDEEGSDLAQRVRKNFATSGRPNLTADLKFSKLKESFGGVFEGLDLQKFASAYWNPEAGWVEADRAVDAMLKEAISKGVKYLQGEVSDLVLGENGLKGVRLKDGRVLRADKIVLATGAWTSQVMTRLEDKLGLEEDQRVEQQVKAAGVCVAHFHLDTEEKERFNKMPVLVYGADADMQPPPSSNLLKITNAESFTNTITTSSGHRISVPSSRPQYAVPTALKEESLEVINRIVPCILAKHQSVTHWRLCWDAITPSQHQIITRHPDGRLGNLFLAVGGSFHSWKFLPIIGKYVSNVLEGIGNGEEKDEKWGWKEERWNSETKERGVHEKAAPKREISYLEALSTKSKL